MNSRAGTTKNRRTHRIDPLYSRLSASAETIADSAVSSDGSSCSNDAEAFEISSDGEESSKTNDIEATESQISVATNLAKCICGAGSFALPHVFLEEGILGGFLAMTLCGGFAAYTMKSLAESKDQTHASSYVELAEVVLGSRAANTVFVLTLCASFGVCSTYLVFISQTLESLSNDVNSQNYIRQIFPDTSEFTWETIAMLLLFPLCCIRNYRVFALTSALGVFAVVGGILVTLASGIFVDPGWDAAFNGFQSVKFWPSSLAVAFGSSFGTIAYLFCINFLVFPIMNSMKRPEKYGVAVNAAVVSVWLLNVVFAILCLGFYGKNTQDLVLANLDNGPYLSALKLLLCVDLLFTFPIVFSSGRQILENAVIGATKVEESPGKRAALVAGAVVACFGLAQIGGFGVVANLVGGVAQGTLAFIVPPTIALTIARRKKSCAVQDEAAQWLVGAFGVIVVSAVSYSTVAGMME